MYDAKAKYYSEKGLDKRGMQAAYKAMCESYIKILKIDLTADNFVSIKVNPEDVKEDKGYSKKLSEWMIGFVRTGQVHPDDIERFLDRFRLDQLREYFYKHKKDFIHIYKRKTDDYFTQVMVEMIPAKEYTDERQIVYLYVKDISAERRIDTRISIQTDGKVIFDGKEFNVTINDVSENGISFVSERVYSLYHGITLEFTDNAIGRSFNNTIDCEIVRLSKNIKGEKIYGCIFKKKSRKLMQYIQYRTLEEQLQQVDETD